MYAIIETGGKQYRVTEGTKLKVEKLGLEEGATVSFDKVLLVGEEGNVTVGVPYVSGAAVQAKVLANDKHKKVIVFKYKNKTNYRRFRGHRQPYTLVQIEGISRA